MLRSTQVWAKQHGCCGTTLWPCKSSADGGSSKGTNNSPKEGWAKGADTSKEGLAKGTDQKLGTSPEKELGEASLKDTAENSNVGHVFRAITGLP